MDVIGSRRNWSDHFFPCGLVSTNGQTIKVLILSSVLILRIQSLLHRQGFSERESPPSSAVQSSSVDRKRSHVASAVAVPSVKRSKVSEGCGLSKEEEDEVVQPDVTEPAHRRSLSRESTPPVLIPNGFCSSKTPTWSNEAEIDRKVHHLE